MLFRSYSVSRLLKNFGTGYNLDVSGIVAKRQEEFSKMVARYPLLRAISTYRSEPKDIVTYINLMDQSLGF